MEEKEKGDEPSFRELSEGEMDERLSIGMCSLQVVIFKYNYRLHCSHISISYILTALQISAAMVYLHNHSVIFRDLKPDNIGFDGKEFCNHNLA